MGPVTVKPDLKATLRLAAAALGFAECGFTTFRALECGPLLRNWLDAGRHGGMDYLQGDLRKRLEPAASLSSVASVVVVAWPYQAPPPLADWRETLRGRIAAYALGIDYHQNLRVKLEELAETIRSVTGSAAMLHIDAGPLVEKELARRAGIGWYGHNTNILSKTAGSYLLLGCLLTEFAFEPDPPFTDSHCGRCRACVPACPTGALDSRPTIDARRCISYLTIEHRGPIAPQLRSRMGNWVFGCDVCQEVCPWNESGPAPVAFLNPSLVELLEMSESKFYERYRPSAVHRSKRRGLARNAAIALGNSNNPAAIEALEQAACGHDEPLVRAHAAWAIGRFRGLRAEKALERASAQPQLPPVVRELDAARLQHSAHSSSRTKLRSIVE